MTVLEKEEKMKQKIGVVGVGALGSIVVQALVDGKIDGYELIGVSDLNKTAFDVPHLSTEDVVKSADIIVECLPPAAAPALAKQVLDNNKTLILISSSALLLYPEIGDWIQASSGRIIVPSGAISGLDAVSALKEGGIDRVTIRTTKPPKGLTGAPYVIENNIDMDDLSEKTCIFSGNAYDAAKAFPANVNVAATLSYAGLGPEKTQVEVWADPDAKGNSHEIVAKGGSSTITSRVDNLPDPNNPKSSMLAGYSIIATLKKLNKDLVVI